MQFNRSTLCVGTCRYGAVGISVSGSLVRYSCHSVCT